MEKNCLENLDIIASPESKGLASENIIRFYRRLDEKKIPIHSVIIYSEDAVVSRRYYAPVKKGSLHRMFSISKSITSLAVGILVSEGKLSLSDRIVSYFPEKIEGQPHPYLAAMTIENMLMMRTCYASTTYNKFDMNSDWVGSFFTAVPTHKPGTVFHYDTSSAHVLAALVEKISGKKLWDYFREKLSPLKLSSDSYFLCDGNGVSMGGSGLMATTEDLLKIGLLLLNNGCLNGNQLISKNYLERATANLTPNLVACPVPAEGSGYGYMFWRNERNGYSCYGMGGQYIQIFPDKKLILITTADTQGYQGANQVILDAFYEEIYDKLSPGRCPEENTDACNKLRELESAGTLPLLTSSCPLDFHILPSLNLVKDSGNGLTNPDISDTGLLHPLDNKGYFTAISLRLSSEQSELILYKNDEKYSLFFAPGKITENTLPLYGMKCYAVCSEPDDRTLYIKLYVIDTSIGSVHFELYFDNDGITVYMKKIEESLFSEFNGHYYFPYS